MPPFAQKVVKAVRPSEGETTMIQSKVKLSKDEQEVVDILLLISVLAERVAKRIIKISLSRKKEACTDGKRLHNRQGTSCQAR